MSHYMTALAMKQKGLKPTTKIVLYWIADHHNGETGDCFPSHKRLADLCEISDRDVRRQIFKLVELGLIQIENRSRSNGSQSSNSYKLNMRENMGRTNSPTPQDTLSDHPLTNCPTLNLGTNNLGNITTKNMSIFDDLWKIYPKKVGKGTAKKALAKAMTKATADQIQHSLAVFVRAWGNQDKKFMPHLATWLNGERWDDEIQEASLQDMSSDQQMQAILGSLTNDRKLLQ